MSQVGVIMDRREFLKSCALMAAFAMVTGCRKLPDFSDPKIGPALKQFEDEVRMAVSMGGPGMNLVPVKIPKPRENALNRFGMAIDLDACNGCGDCILACVKENNIPLVPEEAAARKQFMHWIQMRGGVPFMCGHCGDAPCEKVCPTGAANHTPDGLSAMMYKRCTGSRFCGANCPMSARKFNFHDAEALGLSRKFNDKVPVRGKGVMEKCSMCIQRLQDDRLRFKTENPSPDGSGKQWAGRGVKTACAEACPRNAIVFGNWADENSPLVRAAKGRVLYAPAEIAQLDPSVVYMRGRR